MCVITKWRTTYSQQDIVTPITTTGTMTSTTAPTGPISSEAVSMSSTPPVSSTGVEERIL